MFLLLENGILQLSLEFYYGTTSESPNLVSIGGGRHRIHINETGETTRQDLKPSESLKRGWQRGSALILPVSQALVTGLLHLRSLTSSKEGGPGPFPLS